MYSRKSYLVEANIVGVLAEALTADVEVVLADKTGLVSANAAIEQRRIKKI